jgi:hypothetical protein
MVKLFWPQDPVLQTVHPGEAAVKDLRQRIYDALGRAFKPLEVCWLFSVSPAAMLIRRVT